MNTFIENPFINYFKQLSPRSGQTMLIKKWITCNKDISDIYYYFIIYQNNEFVPLVSKRPLHYKQPKFDYTTNILPIIVE